MLKIDLKLSKMIICINIEIDIEIIPMKECQ